MVDTVNGGFVAWAFDESSFEFLAEQNSVTIETEFGYVAGAIGAIAGWSAQLNATLLNNDLHGPIGAMSEIDSAVNLTAIGNSISIPAGATADGFTILA